MNALIRHPLLKQLTVYGFSASLAQLLMMIYALLLARALGPENYGLFAGNYALAGLTIFFVNWGMDTWMLREGGIHPNPRLLSSTVLRTKLVTGMLWAAGLVILAPLVRPSLFPGILMLICAIDVLGESALITLISGLNIQKRTGQASQILLVGRVGRLAGGILLILIGVKSPLIFAGLRLLATLISLGMGWFLFRPSFSGEGISSPVSTIKSSLVYGIPELLALVYAQVDVTLLGFLASKREVGEYSPALSLVNALTIVPNSIFYIVVPLLSKKFQSENRQFRKAAVQMVGIYALVGLVMTLGVALVGKPVIDLFLGERYNQTEKLVLILSPILFMKSISYASASFFSRTRSSLRLLPLHPVWLKASSFLGRL